MDIQRLNHVAHRCRDAQETIYSYDPSGHRLELAAHTTEPGELDGERVRG